MSNIRDADRFVIGGVGDVFLNRDDPASAFNPTRDLLRACDVLFGNCEGAFTDRTTTAPSAGLRVASPTGNGRGLGAAGFHVLSLANNHTVDAGWEGLRDTIQLLRGQGIAVTGAGENVADAWRPCLVERSGRTIAFLAYTCVYRDGYNARGGTPGVAALRVHSTTYFPSWNIYSFEPGAQPQTRTFPYPEDLDQLKLAIHDARNRAEIVVVSMHWGDSRLPFVLTDYEKLLGRAAIEFGADIVFGHHHHFLKGIEIYQGKPIFFGMGHFVFDLIGLEDVMPDFMIQQLRQSSGTCIFPRSNSPRFPFHEDARLTFVAYVSFSGASIADVLFVPCEIVAPDNTPRPLEVGSDRFKAVIDYLDQANEEGDLATSLEESEVAFAGFKAVSVRKATPKTREAPDDRTRSVNSVVT